MVDLVYITKLRMRVWQLAKLARHFEGRRNTGFVAFPLPFAKWRASQQQAGQAQDCAGPVDDRAVQDR